MTRGSNSTLAITLQLNMTSTLTKVSNTGNFTISSTPTIIIRTTNLSLVINNAAGITTSYSPNSNGTNGSLASSVITNFPVTTGITYVNYLNANIIDTPIINATTTNATDLKVSSRGCNNYLLLSSTNTQDLLTSIVIPNYVFHSRTYTTTSTLSLPMDNYLLDGQYLFFKKIGTGNYQLVFNADGISGTTILTTAGTSVSFITISDNNPRQFIYNKPNKRWIQIM
jgi:hypothetical protein